MCFTIFSVIRTQLQMKEKEEHISFSVCSSLLYAQKSPHTEVTCHMLSKSTPGMCVNF